MKEFLNLTMLSFSCVIVTVPAKNIVSEIFPDDVVKQLQQLLGRRFEVHYYIDNKDCWYCMKNDWLCWRDTNLTKNNTCLYENGVQSIYKALSATLSSVPTSKNISISIFSPMPCILCINSTRALATNEEMVGSLSLLYGKIM